MPPTLEAMAEGYVQTSLLFCAIEVGLDGIMGDSVLDVEEIAWRGGFSSETLIRLLRAWKRIGIVAEPRPAGFCLMEVGSSLVSVEGNTLPFALVHGVEPFDFRRTNPDASRSFNRWLACATAQESATLTTALE